LGKNKKNKLDMCQYWIKLKKDYQENKKNDLYLTVRLLEFAWNKRYKGLLFVLWLIGLLLIVILEYIIKYFVNIENIVASDKMLSIIYFSTGIIIFWYTRETFDLKKIQNKELKEVRKQTAFEMKPFIRMQWKKRTEVVVALGGDKFDENTVNKFTDIEIINDGRGIAHDIEIFVKFKVDSRGDAFETVEDTLTLKKCEAVKSLGGITQLKYLEQDKKIKSKKDEQLSEIGAKESNVLSEAHQYENPIIIAYEIVCFFRDIDDNLYIEKVDVDREYGDGFKITKLPKRISVEQYKTEIKMLKK
jgi:hypothetical protein